jgi:hypothetical protein
MHVGNAVIEMRSPATSLIALAFVSFAFFVASAAAQTNGSNPDSEAANLVATQIREQGYDCQDPTSATRDQEASEPNETVWMLTCKNASYRVRLVPNMAAQVEQIE